MTQDALDVAHFREHLKLELPVLADEWRTSYKAIRGDKTIGAAMVIAPGGEVLFSQLAQDASDNASPDEMLAVLARAA
jgi:hypothetical protein